MIAEAESWSEIRTAAMLIAVTAITGAEICKTVIEIKKENKHLLKKIVCYLIVHYIWLIAVINNIIFFYKSFNLTIF